MRNSLQRNVILIAIALAFVLSVDGCKPKDISVSGQVFVVTKGAENVKLGDVQILLVEKSLVMKFLESKQAAFESQQRSFADEAQNATSKAQKANDDYLAFIAAAPFKTNADYVQLETERDQAIQGIQKLDIDLKKLQATNERLRIAARGTLVKRTPEFIYFEFKANSIFIPEWENVPVRSVQAALYEPKEFKDWRDFIEGKQQEAKGLIDKRAPLVAKEGFLEKQLDSLANEAESQQKGKISEAAAQLEGAKTKFAKFRDDFYLHRFDGFPVSLIKEVHSDADGKFSFSYPSTRPFTIFGTADRMLGDTSEKYYWLIDAPAEPTPSLILSNKKLIEVDPDGYLKSFSHL